MGGRSGGGEWLNLRLNRVLSQEVTAGHGVWRKPPKPARAIDLVGSDFQSVPGPGDCAEWLPEPPFPCRPPHGDTSLGTSPGVSVAEKRNPSRGASRGQAMAGRGWCWGFQGLRCSVKMGHVLSRPQRRVDQVASEGCPRQSPCVQPPRAKPPQTHKHRNVLHLLPLPRGQDRTAGAEGEGAGLQTQPQWEGRQGQARPPLWTRA